MNLEEHDELVVVFECGATSSEPNFPFTAVPNIDARDAAGDAFTFLYKKSH